MSQIDLPKGQTRISDAVIDTVAMAAAREVRGVIDIVGLAKGVAIGAAVGVAVGTVGGGVGGAVLGASAGSAAGVVAVHLLTHRQKQHSFHAMYEEAPTLQLRLSAEYGVDLRQLAGDVREQVRASIRDIAGLEVKDIEVVFAEVVLPYKLSARKPSTEQP